MGNIKDISKQPLVEWGGQVVITTAQLAEVYGATTNNIKDNFSRNKDRFTEGKHYILLTGQSLREFKNQAAESDLVSKKTSQLYLWTRRGASRHCKILGTDKAWEQFDYLEENYFDRQNQKPPQLPQTTMELLELHYKALKEVDSKVDKAEERITALDKKLETALLELPLLGVESDKVDKALKHRGVEVVGGKESNAYHDKRLLKRVYWDIHGQLRREFQVGTYKAIKRNQTDLALKFIAEYQLPFALREEIETANAQQRLDV